MTAQQLRVGAASSKDPSSHKKPAVAFNSSFRISDAFRISYADKELIYKFPLTFEKENNNRGWRNCSVVNSTYCSYRQPEFNSKHLHANNCLHSSSRDMTVLSWPPQTVHDCDSWTHMQTKHLYMQNKNSVFKILRKKL